MVHAFIPRIWEAEAGRVMSYEFDAHLLYRENSTTVKASQGSTVLKIQKKNVFELVSLYVNADTPGSTCRGES